MVFRTGASSGIGRAIALLFAHEGAHVVCADLHHHAGGVDDADSDEDNTELDTHVLIRQSGGNSMFVPVDIRLAQDVENLVGRTVQQFGRLDMYGAPFFEIHAFDPLRLTILSFVNGPGFFVEIDNPQPIWSMPESTWDATMNTNARGAFLGCKYASAQMIHQDPHPNGDQGWIINTSSVLGLTGQQNCSSYCAAASAVCNLTKAAALDCAPYRVHVNAICAGCEFRRTASGWLSLLTTSQTLRLHKCRTRSKTQTYRDIL